MSQKYTSSQPEGFKNHIKKVAIVGAGGNLGKYLSSALLKTGQHTVTAITRADSTSTPPDGVVVVNVNYQDPKSLVDALKGHDTLIITMSVMAPPGSEIQLIDAAQAAGISWIMPNYYSADPDQKEMQRDYLIGPLSEKVREYVDTKTTMSWVCLACNFWYEHSLCSFKWAFGFDLDNREATFYDDGNTKINTSTWPLCGLAVAKLLSLPILPENEHDQSLTLDRFRNQFVFISSFYVSQKDMFASLLRVTGAKESEWTIKYEDSKQRFEDGHKEMAAGSRAGFIKQLYARVFFPDGCGTIESKLHNELLGLPKEDLDEYTQKAIELAQSGYGKAY